MTRLLFVGGDFDRKGGQMLLNWAAHTSKTNWSLDIVTRQALNITDSRVTVHNNLASNDPKLIELYQNAHLFVLPTLADCYSIAGIEALACGLPVILSLTGGTGDIIVDGKTGYLLNSPSPEEFDARLSKLVTDTSLRESMAKAARTDALDRYDVVKNIRKTVRIMLDSI
jgi:glycosyltransferase involved in cell wall biosynthesis